MTDEQPPQGSQVIEKEYVAKVMKRLGPFLALLYAFCILDRGNVANAKLTMSPDLGFSDAVYGFGAGIFFISYFIFEIPSNLFMEKVGARWWISRIMVSWGIVSAAMMFVHSPMSFYVLRFLLGVAEAGFFPGIILYFTYWIPATSRARAISLFLMLSAFLQFFGGPMAGALLKMPEWTHGLAGLRGWQWLFLMEGIPSVLLGVLVLFVMPDRPTNTKWLTDDEKSWIAQRLEAESHHKETVKHFPVLAALTKERLLRICPFYVAFFVAVRYSWPQLYGDIGTTPRALADALVTPILYGVIAGALTVIGASLEPRIRHMCLVMIVSSTASNAVGFFQPSLVMAKSGMVWSPSYVSTILAIPSIVGAIGMMAAAGHSDRTGLRRMHILLGYTVAAMGYLACVYAPSGWSAVAALSLFSLGERIGAGSYWALTTNLLGARAAASGIAMINSVGNLGGFIGPTIMGRLMVKMHGNYAAGLYMAAGLMLLSAVLGGMMCKHPTHEHVGPEQTEASA